ncbi:hypothetical protein Solca_0454 [Solitalea canadensis DSM 3403]|uniref:Lipoprotein n=1 Tax=Solitalea canadensis (strain ATCC 29591 / DSM 3403 / JCM 21819 / LMG 8368 / NBRC 15130 / NCIMB 12057 / USAM 9D) TaxID=929556 RepID=H8KT15_SOLCM|nr:hypothetical protein Solca_0454 [Solitalea canadensis DSM 3403]
MCSSVHKVIFIFIVSVIVSCTNNRNKKINEIHSNLLKTTLTNGHDSVLVIMGQVFRKKTSKQCYQLSNNELKEDLGFLNTNICYLEIDTINNSLLAKKNIIEAF